MGVCFSSGGSGTKIVEPNDSNTLRILCLGVGGCGKTTFISQMKFLHKHDIDPDNLETFAKVIRRNFTVGMKEIISIAKQMKWDFLPENEQHVETVIALTRELNHSLTQENYEVLKSLWEDPTSKRVVAEKRSHLGVTHIDYYWGRVKDIIQPTYAPNEEDILHVRNRTAGAYSVLIRYENSFFEFYDVGGQKPEREKWGKILSTVDLKAIIYFVASDEWDVIDAIEDRDFSQTKLQISRAIFRELVGSDIVPKNLPVTVFLNRFDMFSERINSDAGMKSFRETFENYKGADKNPKEAINCVIDFFKDGISDKHMQRVNKFHCTTALDRNAMVPIWNAVREQIFESRLDEDLL